MLEAVALLFEHMMVCSKGYDEASALSRRFTPAIAGAWEVNPKRSPASYPYAAGHDRSRGY
jgi:hypothetical protein